MTQDNMSLSKCLGDTEGSGSLACCSPWGCKKSDASKRLNECNEYGRR